jgi:hypothetical protein
MALGELPIEISLRVHHPHRFEERQKLPKTKAIRVPRPYNIECFLLQNHPDRNWHQAEGDVVVGVPEPNVIVRQGRPGNVAVRAARNRIRELVKGATVVETICGPQWSLPPALERACEIRTHSLKKINQWLMGYINQAMPMPTSTNSAKDQTA